MIKKNLNKNDIQNLYSFIHYIQKLKIELTFYVLLDPRSRDTYITRKNSPINIRSSFLIFFTLYNHRHFYCQLDGNYGRFAESGTANHTSSRTEGLTSTFCEHIQDSKEKKDEQYFILNRNQTSKN